MCHVIKNVGTFTTVTVGVWWAYVGLKGFKIINGKIFPSFRAWSEDIKFEKRTIDDAIVVVDRPKTQETKILLNTDVRRDLEESIYTPAGMHVWSLDVTDRLCDHAHTQISSKFTLVSFFRRDFVMAGESSISVTSYAILHPNHKIFTWADEKYGISGRLAKYSAGEFDPAAVYAAAENLVRSKIQ